MDDNKLMHDIAGKDYDDGFYKSSYYY